MHLRDFTPLLGSPNQIRAGRIYPGGENLDRLIGEKTEPETGWFYPEAWIFSPNPAINTGSTRTTEGQTILFDCEGNTYTWEEYITANPSVLNGSSLAITVKLLDGSCTLPKEFHFHTKDERQLREFPLLRDSKEPLIKPEVWIRHPTASGAASPSFIGFNRPMDPHFFAAVVHQGVDAMESVMNQTTIPPGHALYIDGGHVHSLGPGLYFEVLSCGDQKVTLQDSFAGRPLTEEEQMQGLYTGGPQDLARALTFIDYSSHGEAFLEQCTRTPRGEGIEKIVDTPHFRAEWLRIPAGERRVVVGGQPHVLVTAKGTGLISTDREILRMQTRTTTFSMWKETGLCYAAVVHGSTKDYCIKNTGTNELILLRAYEGTSHASAP